MGYGGGENIALDKTCYQLKYTFRLLTGITSSPQDDSNGLHLLWHRDFQEEIRKIFIWMPLYRAVGKVAS